MFSALRTAAPKASRCYLVNSSPSLPIVSSRGVGGVATRHGNDPETLEQGNKGILDQHHPDSKVEPHWNEELASDSEAFVKAIRVEVKHAGKDIEELTEAVLKESKKSDPKGNK